MNEFLEKASSHLTGNKNISEINTEELERIAKEHPYFSVSQVLLAKKYKVENHTGFLPQVQKAALYFNNPYWLHYQLLDTKPDIIFSEQEEETEEKIASAQAVVQTEDETPYKFNVAEDEHQPDSFLNNNEISAASSLAKETLSPKESENQSGEEVEITPDEFHPEKEEILEEIAEQNIQAEESISEEQPEIPAPVESELEESSPVENFQEDVTPTEEDKQAEDALSEKDLIATVIENTLVQPTSIDETLAEPEISLASSKEETISPASENITGTSTPDQLKEDSEAPATPNEPLIPIEPYYTVDYFASQGIKLVLEKNPQDKLGKQLRSFTDWLKHMKKLGPEDALKSTQDTEVDPTIKKIADTSNTPEEIVTEAMADVLIKQGKNDQAIEVYNKLSFLNPDKSTYFANQIQKLKGT
ncbi:MAG TPA: hypothetical protein VF622_19120 [Segetibacter sp.]|jgi:hypothetical protein